MPTVIPNTDLRNNYNAGSERYHEYAEPIFETDGGMGAPPELCIKTYEQFYAAVQEGLKQIREGETEPMEEAMKYIKTLIE
jgi:hypothetical protein